MNTVSEILAIVGAFLPILAGFLTFLLKFVKNEKVKRALSETLRLTEILQPLIVKAEEFTHYTGAEKKQYVLTLANQFAIENKVKFDSEKVAGLIDQIVETTKKVNARQKDCVSRAIEPN